MPFTGVALYDVFSTEIGEDMRDLITMISPRVTKFLDDIGDGKQNIKSNVYTWQEKSLLPDTYTVSSAIASSAAASGGLEVGANASLIRVGDILRNSVAGNELMMVTSLGTSATTIYVTRAYSGTSANSSAAGVTLEFVGSAVTEGSGVRTVRRTTRANKTNFIQIFREDINVSTLANNALQKIPGLPPIFDQESIDKAVEVMKQLERSVLMGRTNGNTIGADDAETTLAGIYNSIATNITSHATYTNSILNEVLANINTYTDLDINIEKYGLYAGTTAYRKISNSKDSRIQQVITENAVGVMPVERVYTDFGPVPIKNIRWLPTGSVLVLRKDFVEVSPFQGNSFQLKRFEDGDMAQKGYIAGAYGLRFKNEYAHGRLDGIS